MTDCCSRTDIIPDDPRYPGISCLAVSGISTPNGICAYNADTVVPIVCCSVIACYDSPPPPAEPCEIESAICKG